MYKHKRVLVLAELEGEDIHKISYELLAKGKEICEKTMAELYCLVIGNKKLDLRELNYRGADKVFYIRDGFLNYPEEVIYKENIVGFIKEYMPETVLIGATNFGRSLAPRIAAALKTGLTADCTDLKVDQDGKLIQIRPAFSNNILAHIKTLTIPQLATIRYKEFREAERDINRRVDIVKLEPYAKAYNGTTVTSIFIEEDFNITDAEVVVAGGRGIKKKDDIKMLRELADLLGGKVAASRALVDAGMISTSHQIGYSGNRVKPKVYFACGISGAPQHIAGMKDAELIIAINKDPSAPIFNIADYGYVGDLYQIIPKIIEEVSKEQRPRDIFNGGICSEYENC